MSLCLLGSFLKVILNAGFDPGGQLAADVWDIHGRLLQKIDGESKQQSSGSGGEAQ